MIPVPNRNILFVLCIPLPFFIGGIFYSLLLTIGIALDIGILVVCLYDYLAAVNSRELSFIPEVIVVPGASAGRTFSIGRKNSLKLNVCNNSAADVILEVKVDLPAFFEDLTEHRAFTLKKGEKLAYTFALLPCRRGVYLLKYIHFRYPTGAKLFTINGKREINLEVEVFPDIKELNQYMGLARRNRLADMGIHKNRFSGMGSELEYLREYQRDDDAAHIDWKVTTRINRPVTRVFQMESSNQITLVMDCGRLTVSEQAGLNMLDYTINAALMLAHVIFKMGDQLRIIAYCDRIMAELPPTKGKNALEKVTRFLTRLEPEMVESNYRLVFEYIRKRLSKRSVVIFFTDMMDDINFELFLKYLQFINKKHLTLFILLQDSILQQQADRTPHTLSGIFASAAAREMYLRRYDAVRKLKLNKINVIDTLPGELTPKLVDKYLEIKSKNRV